MLRDKAVTLLQIRPDETRMVAWMALLFLLVQAGQGFGDTAAFGLFVSKNADNLPYMYMPLGLIVFTISLAYTASLGRFQNASVVLWFLFGMMFVLLVEWVALALLKIEITQIYWLTFNGMGVVLGTLLWTTAGEVCDARQAKRLFPLFTSVGILGSVLGSYFSGMLAKPLGSDRVHLLILVYTLILVGAFFILRNLTRAYFTPEPPTPVGLNLISDLRSGYDFVLGSGLFRLLAFSAILFSVLFFALDFPFSQIVSTYYLQDEVAVTAFKGSFTSLLTLVTFFASLVIANRLYARIGIVNSILIMPVIYLLGFIAFYIFFRSEFQFQIAVSFRFVQQVILGGVMGTAWSALFNVVPIERRGQVLAFMNGVPSQIGVMLSGLLLIVGTQIFSTAQILLMGAVVALACFYFVQKMRAEYGNALVSALQAGRVEVFNDEDEAFAGYEQDPAALQATFKALHDPNPDIRRLAAEMLAKMGSPLAIPDLVSSLSDEDPDVRAASIKALTELDARGVANQIMLGLDDPADVVREQTLASLTKLEVAASPELTRTLERLLRDPNVRIGARAAVVLMHLGRSGPAETFLTGLLQDTETRARIAALDAYRAIASNSKDAIPFSSDLLLKALADPAAEVRRQALLTLRFFKTADMIEVAARHLTDPDAGVRRTASEALRQFWPESRAVCLRILNETDGDPAMYVLDAIPAGDEETLHPLRSYIHREVSEIRYMRMLVDSLPVKGRMVKLLADTLHSRILLVEERLVKSVGLFGNPRAMQLVRKGLLAGTASARSAALEALETLGDKRITNDVLPILDRGGVFQSDSDLRMTPQEISEILLTHEDRWLRALGPYVVIEQNVEEFFPQVRKMFVDEDPLVKDSARDAWSRLGGSVNMKTLKTLSTLDRVLLLREVPMFSGLSPEDLEKIAEIAEEQLFHNQQLLCREGEPGHTLFIIASGVVEVLKKVGDTEQVLAARTTGDFVGEMAILELAPRSATLRAKGGVRTLVIDGDSFNTILLDRPQVAVSVLRRMSQRVRELNEKVGAGG